MLASGADWWREHEVGGSNGVLERREAPRREVAERRSAALDPDDYDDVGGEEGHSLRALIAAVQDASRRDREIYDNALKEIKARLDRIEERHSKLVGRVLVSAGAFAAIVYLLNWVGPTVVRAAIKALIGP